MFHQNSDLENTDDTTDDGSEVTEDGNFEDEELSNEITEDEALDTNSTDTLDTSATVSSVSSESSLPESSLGLTNILNILLIVVGVLLIFLAIAILIRLKS